MDSVVCSATALATSSSASRVPSEFQTHRSFAQNVCRRDGVGPGPLKFAPDLAIEVLSPRETAWELEEKLDDYLVSGTPSIWVVDPRRHTVMIVSGDAPVRWLREGDILDGGNVVPGFACPVTEIFDGIAPRRPESARQGHRR